MFSFTFRTLDRIMDIKTLVGFISKQDNKYPDYQNWVQRTEYELYIGYKKAILALSYGQLVGNLIYQPHKK